MGKKERRIPPYVSFLLFNMCFFMMDTTASYFNIYLNGIGLSKSTIGIIGGTGSLGALAFQPFLGMLADRSHSKNRMLQMMIISSAALYPLILVSEHMIYILVVFCLYSIVRNFQSSLNTSMSVEFAERSGTDYGPIRMMGAIGYAVMMAIVAQIANRTNGAKLT
ncbi:MAG: MFS transporter, partial [Clostridiales bacterium]|nr:MFS transporter [Clostridiales bacterium]